MKKLTDEFVRGEINRTGEKLLETSIYINHRTKLDIQCAHCHSVYITTWDQFTRKIPQRAVRCACRITRRGKFLIRYDYFESCFLFNGYASAFWTKGYVHTMKNITLYCQNEHEFITTPHKFLKKNHRCYCDKEEPISIDPLTDSNI